MKIRIPQFTQTNLAGVLERADEILLALKELRVTVYQQQSIVTILQKDAEVGDEWEQASLALVKVELLERAVRAEDPQVEKFPPDWNGGLLEKKE